MLLIYSNQELKITSPSDFRKIKKNYGKSERNSRSDYLFLLALLVLLVLLALLVLPL